MFILKKGHQPGVYVPLRALFLVCNAFALTFDVCFLDCSICRKMESGTLNIDDT